MCVVWQCARLRATVHCTPVLPPSHDSQHSCSVHPHAHASMHLRRSARQRTLIPTVTVRCSVRSISIDRTLLCSVGCQVVKMSRSRIQSAALAFYLRIRSIVFGNNITCRPIAHSFFADLAICRIVRRSSHNDYGSRQGLLARV